MPTCPNCGTPLRPPATLLSRLVICHHCGKPASVGEAASAETIASRTAPPRRMLGQEPPARQTFWYVTTPDGRELGPFTRIQLDRQAAAGRLDATCRIRQSGWRETQPATMLYPNLPPQAAAVEPQEAPFVPAPPEFHAAGSPTTSESASPRGQPWKVAFFLLVACAVTMTAATGVFLNNATKAMFAAGLYGSLLGLAILGGALFDWAWFRWIRKRRFVVAVLGELVPRWLAAVFALALLAAGGFLMTQLIL